MKSPALAALLTLILAGCAVRATAHPPSVQWLVLYGRITECAGQPIPPQLTPQAARRLPQGLIEPVPPPPCTTLEVGAKSYADSISALGAAIVGILAKVALF